MRRGLPGGDRRIGSRPRPAPRHPFLTPKSPRTKRQIMSVKSSPWILVARRPGGGVEPVTRIKGGRTRYIRSSAVHDLWKWRHRPEGVAAETGGGILQVGEVLAQRVREPGGEHADPGPALRDEWGLTLLDHLPGPALLIRVPEPSPVVLAEIEERIRRVKERESTDVLTDVPGLPRLYVQAVRRGGGAGRSARSSRPRRRSAPPQNSPVSTPGATAILAGPSCCGSFTGSRPTPRPRSWTRTSFATQRRTGCWRCRCPGAARWRSAKRSRRD